MTSKEIKELCRSLGADLVGIATPERFADAPEGYRPEDVLPSVRLVIVLATVLPKETIHFSVTVTHQ